MLNQKTKKKKSLNGAGARPSVSPLRSADWTAMRAASRSGTFLAAARRARPRDAVRYANGGGSSSPRMRANVQANCCWGSVGGRYSHRRERKEKERKGRADSVSLRFIIGARAALVNCQRGDVSFVGSCCQAAPTASHPRANKRNLSTRYPLMSRMPKHQCHTHEEEKEEGGENTFSPECAWVFFFMTSAKGAAKR